MIQSKTFRRDIAKKYSWNILKRKVSMTKKKMKGVIVILNLK